MAPLISHAKILALFMFQLSSKITQDNHVVDIHDISNIDNRGSRFNLQFRSKMPAVREGKRISAVSQFFHQSSLENVSNEIKSLKPGHYFSGNAQIRFFWGQRA